MPLHANIHRHLAILSQPGTVRTPCIPNSRSSSVPNPNSDASLCNFRCWRTQIFTDRLCCVADIAGIGSLQSFWWRSIPRSCTYKSFSFVLECHALKVPSAVFRVRSRREYHCRKIIFETLVWARMLILHPLFFRDWVEGNILSTF